MSRLPTEKPETSLDILTNWVSISMALIFALPSLGIFLGIYYMTGSLVMGATLGFGVHFVILAFSGKISKFLTRVIG